MRGVLRVVKNGLTEYKEGEKFGGSGLFSMERVWGVCVSLFWVCLSSGEKKR